MAKGSLIEIPVDSSGLVGVAAARSERGRTRLVPMVPISPDGRTRLPCIWRSHEIVEITRSNGTLGRGNKCLLLASTNPPVVLPAEVDLDAWQSFGTGPVEW